MLFQYNIDMTTFARALYDNGIYHVYNRGHNHMTLYHDINDFRFYLRCIDYCQEKINFDMYSICLMTNHYHLLIKDPKLKLPVIMDTINSIYARYFNEKYNHKGSIFDGPFESNPIADDYGFTKVYRYIIRNPVAAGMTHNIYEYPWATTNRDKDIYRLIDFKYVDEIFKKVCNLSYDEYLKSDVDDLWVDDIEVHRLDDNIAEELFYKILYKLTKRKEFDKKSIDDNTQKEIIRWSYYRGITLKQLSKLSGYSISSLHYMKT